MATKRQTKNIKTLDCFHKFEIKKVGGDTYIQGWANKAVVDRGQDIIKMDAWNLDNYKKVPTILFNHDKDKPIGKAIDVRPTDQGLWIKAKISNSKDPTISMVRDLIQEGMLNAFSVGFDAKDEQRNTEGINEIKNAELYECSVVTLPMNQDSVFDVSTKSLVGLSRNEAISRILKAKGAWVAQAVHGKIGDMEKSGTKRDELLSQISSHAGISKDDLTQVMAGNITPVPEKVMDAFKEVLGMDSEELKKLDAGDVQTQKGTDDMQEEPMEKDGGEEADSDQDAVALIGITIPKDLADTSDDAQTMAADAGYEPISVQDAGDNWYVLLEDPADFQDETSQLNMGDNIMGTVGIRKPIGDQPSEDQEPPLPGSSDQSTPPTDAQAEGKATPPPPPEEDPKKKPKIPPHPSQGHKKPVVEGGTPPSNAWTDYGKPKDGEQEQAPPAPDSSMSAPPAPHADANPPAGEGQPPAEEGDKKPDDQPSDEYGGLSKQDYDQAISQFKQELADVQEHTPGKNPPAWADNPDAWNKAEEAAAKTYDRSDPSFYAVTTWLYLNRFGGGKKSGSEGRTKAAQTDPNTAPISGGGDATIPVDDNPYLAQARQTNVLLGVLIKEVQQMCAAMQGGAIGAQGQMGTCPKEEKDEPMTDEQAKELSELLTKNVSEYVAILNDKLGKIGA